MLPGCKQWSHLGQGVAKGALNCTLWVVRNKTFTVGKQKKEPIKKATRTVVDKRSYCLSSMGKNTHG